MSKRRATMGTCLVFLLDVICFSGRWEVYCLSGSWLCHQQEGPLAPGLCSHLQSASVWAWVRSNAFRDARPSSSHIYFLPFFWLPWNIFKCFAFAICVLYKMFVKYWFPPTMGLECSWRPFCFATWIHAALAAAKVLLCVPAPSVDLGPALGAGLVWWSQLGSHILFLIW